MTLATALTLIALAGMPAPDPAPIIHDGICPNKLAWACTWYENAPDGTRSYHIAATPTVGPRWTMLHEIGHVMHLQLMGETQWQTFARLRGRRWPRAERVLVEQFAEAYRLCVRPHYLPFARGRLDGLMGYTPTRRLHRRICLLIRRAGEARS